LGNIAKILQFAAAKKGFGEESSFLTTLNPYIIDCHEKFKKFFAECCCSDDIAELSEAFSTDQVKSLLIKQSYLLS
jgi:Ras GTPase-activating-like protein IQGAP2/3/Ras GTPase-activating-like protein IQGAP1